MADFTASPMSGGYDDESDQEYTVRTAPNALTKLTNVTGAVVSLALIAGIGVWGYKLIVRDVSGIPVVRAAQGDMRVRPEKPGGDFAAHQGLSVNVIAAEGTAGKPADELRLAPTPIDLTAEDRIIPAAMVAEAPQVAEPEAASLDVSGALNAGNVESLVAQLTEGVTPMSALDKDVADVVATVTQEVVQEVQAAEVKAAAAVLDAPGVRQSLRPKKRPLEPVNVLAASFVAQSSPAPDNEVDGDSLPKGTRLAQLGAFDSPEVAREQWTKLHGRFGAYLEGKQRVVQKATSGGRVFYRLRAMGFEDIADARRFCSALVAEKADCIPVVTR